MKRIFYETSKNRCVLLVGLFVFFVFSTLDGYGASDEDDVDIENPAPPVAPPSDGSELGPDFVVECSHDGPPIP